MAKTTTALGVLLLLLLGGVGFHWTVNRHYVEPGWSLWLRYKGPLVFGKREMAPKGEFADPEQKQIGVLKEMKGPGRHFYCPVWWKVERVEDVVVRPGQVAIVTSKMGQDLPENQFLVDGRLGDTDYKGILRNAYGPGRYRVHPYAYKFEIIETSVTQSEGRARRSGWVEIPTGYVGVVTRLAGNPLTGEDAGIQGQVLPPGIYTVNGAEQQIDIVEIGLLEKTVIVTRATERDGRVRLDESGEPIVADDSTGINFPSNDGFPIHMDFTAIWGIMPAQAPDAVRKFGNIVAVEEKVVVPQIESICRNIGSKKGAVELLVGESRQQFQTDTESAFKEVLKEKDITLLYGLVRHIYIPQEVRIPIQNANIADELRLTRDQEQVTSRTEGALREAERRVELETARIEADTKRIVAAALAEGNKMAEETRAETNQLVAAIDRVTAELDAQATVVLGEAGAKARQVAEEAKAQKFGLAVDAFGGGTPYNQWVFASNLPDDIELSLLYAGEGTFWTDLKGFTSTLLGKQLKEANR